MQLKTVAAGLAAITLSVSAHAELLGLTLEPAPDIFSSFISVNYNATSDVFAANGFALVLNTGISVEAIAGGSFNITASIDDSGNASGGSLSIGGTVLAMGPPLLTGNLVAFGWHSSGVFEFLFSITGGALANPTYYGSPGSVVGVILSAGGGNFSGNWASNFANTGQGVSDTGIPIPAPAALSIFAAAFCHGRRRRRA